MANVVLCSIDGCGKKRKSAATGYCDGHHRRFINYGDPLKGKPMRAESGAALKWLYENSSHADKLNCLKWPFTDRGKGYGVVMVESGKMQFAHAKMCEIINGQMPDDKELCAHSCGNGTKGCVNPHHLRWATQKENMADRKAHGRGPQGEGSGNAIVSCEDVKKIRELRGKFTQTEIGKMFGITQSAVSWIQIGRNWKEV